MGGKDNIFGNASMEVEDFEFDNNVANVFDDMVSRSVPFYSELQEMFIVLSESFAQPNTKIIDLGCATGTTMVMMAEAIKNKKIEVLGIDNSEQMLDKARDKIKKNNLEGICKVELGDLNEPLNIDNASVVYLNWTLQFVRPLNRDRLMNDIYSGLNRGGALIIAEKIVAADSLINRMYIEYYYNYKKKRGYTKTEITKKREALENVLIPYRVDENIELLKRSGFQTVDVFFRWFNWAGFVAIKK